MNGNLRIALMVTVTLFAAANLPAQTLKWAYSNTNHVQILGWAGDGYGGLVVIEFATTNDYSGRCLWYSPHGRLLLAHDWQQNGENGLMDIVRLTPTELAVRFYPRVGEGETPKNVLRRFKRIGSRIAMVDVELPANEVMPTVPANMTDRRGFFTYGNGIRRYSN